MLLSGSRTAGEGSDELAESRLRAQRSAVPRSTRRTLPVIADRVFISSVVRPSLGRERELSDGDSALAGLLLRAGGPSRLRAGNPYTARFEREWDRSDYAVCSGSRGGRADTASRCCSH